MSAGKFTLHRKIPFIRRPFHQRDVAYAEIDQLRADISQLRSEAAAMAPQSAYLDDDPATVQYRQAYFEVHGSVAPDPALPAAKAYPHSGLGLSYAQKHLGMLAVSSGTGAEIGPLNIPLIPKQTAKILYVDHLNTESLRQKYQTVAGIVEIDRPMVNNSIADTLRDDMPLDYVVASQVLEHVANPIRWLGEVAEILKPSGLLAMSVPDRRFSFDFLRHTTRPADIVSAYLQERVTPDVRSVYDHHSQASFVGMSWATPLSVVPEEIVAGRGAVRPKLATEFHLALTQQALQGDYLDVHAWVFTPASFLITMAQLAGDGFLPFRCRQFYPTDPAANDRGSSSMVALLEKSDGVSPAELRRSFLLPLGSE